jgi:muconolactone delta-isomerase
MQQCLFTSISDLVVVGWSGWGVRLSRRWAPGPSPRYQHRARHERPRRHQPDRADQDIGDQSPPRGTAKPGEWRILGLWGAQDPIEMQTILESLPLYSWAMVETTPLSLHPNDSAIIKS